MHKFDKDARYITYCGGGVMAAGSAYVMTRLGFGEVAVYIALLVPSLDMACAAGDKTERSFS